MISGKSSARAVGTLCAAVLLVTGCATPHEWLAPDSFVTESRLVAEIDRLEQRLEASESRGAQQAAALEQQFDALGDALGDALEELGRTLQQMEGAARARAVAPPTSPPAPALASERIPDGKIVLGRVEWVGFPTLATYLKARIDTGASLASLSATEITTFEREGREWIRFRLGLTREDVAVRAARDNWFELPVRRYVRIVQATGAERRPVISLPMTLGPMEQQVEFTVNDRTRLTHPVLLGRRFMMDLVMVDVSRTFVHPRPEFPGGEPAARAVRDQSDEESDEE